jgi:predicted Fe-Mo cluster-binding NifX family protein
MKLCIPVKTHEGLDSVLSDHFGSAPLFLVVDTAGGQCSELPNDNQHHAHGACQPLEGLRRHGIEGVVCRGMGMRAVQKLNEMGIKAWRTAAGNVREVIAGAGLEEITPERACHQHGCH